MFLFSLLILVVILQPEKSPLSSDNTMYKAANRQVKGGTCAASRFVHKRGIRRNANSPAKHCRLTLWRYEAPQRISSSTHADILVMPVFFSSLM
jgi:hypothetical protein